MTFIEADVKTFWIPRESCGIEKLNLLAAFTKWGVPSAGERSCSAALVAAPCRQCRRHHSSRVAFCKVLCHCDTNLYIAASPD